MSCSLPSSSNGICNSVDREYFAKERFPVNGNECREETCLVCCLVHLFLNDDIRGWEKNYFWNKSKKRVEGYFILLRKGWLKRSKYTLHNIFPFFKDLIYICLFFSKIPNPFLFPIIPFFRGYYLARDLGRWDCDRLCIFSLSSLDKIA